MEKIITLILGLILCAGGIVFFFESRNQIGRSFWLYMALVVVFAILFLKSYMEGWF